MHLFSSLVRKKKWSNGYLMGLVLYDVLGKGSKLMSLVPRLQPCPSAHFFQGNVPKDEIENSHFWVPHHSNEAMGLKK